MKNLPLSRLIAARLTAAGLTAILAVPLLPAGRDYPIRPVPFTQVRLTDGFWAPRLETNRKVTIPYAFRMNEETGRVDNFRKAARLMSGPHLGKRYNDTDVYKAMEGAAYSLLLHPDPALEGRLDEFISVIAKAQEPDGYLYTARTIDPRNPAAGAGPERWYYLRGSHELYNSGHMFEAAVA
ncbi:MAG: glycoside hydrolase family 127 protein, partial [Candidatus Aminicenantes bacterium]|nr:glycoside hydrolase family 127 protein [Candidatus Aminicenantes bacterium]